MLKKFLGILLSGALLLTAAVPAFAASSDSKGLEQAIVNVKKLIDIPNDYTDFNYRTSQDSAGNKLWAMSWNDEEREKGMIQAEMTESGYLVSYSVSDYQDSSEVRLSSQPIDQARQTADAFLKKAAPKIAGSLKLTAKRADSSSYSFAYQQFVNGVFVRGKTADVVVSKATGKVTRYTGFVNSSQTFAENKGTIHEDAALAAYLKEIGVRLQYNSYYDSDKRSVIVFPVYRALTEKRLSIDAKTGKPVDVSKVYDSYMEDGIATEMDAGENVATGGSAKLSKAELEKVSKLKGYQSAAQAEQTVRKAFPSLTSAYPLSSSTMQQDYQDKNVYLWQLSFRPKGSGTEEIAVSSDDEPMKSAYATVNATTGEIVSFSITGANKGKAMTEQQFQASVEKLMKQLNPEKAGKVKFDEEYKRQNEPRPLGSGKALNYYTVRYIRYENGIPFPGNYITATFDAKNNVMTGYRVNWDENVTFPSLTGVKSESEILKYMASAMDFRLQYADASKTAKTLVYDFAGSQNATFNPYNGKRVSYRNETYVEQKLPSYNDISGSKYKQDIEQLTTNGIYVYPSGAFRPDSAITQEKFLRYLIQYMGYSADDSLSIDDLYKTLARRNVVDASEKNPSGAVTRQEAAKFAVRGMGYRDLAEKSELFVYPYQDQVSKSYKGYIAIAAQFGVMGGASGSSFGPTQKLTNGETAQMMVALFQLETEK